MGGKKKLSLKQMERQQSAGKGKKKRGKKKEKSVEFGERERSGIIPPDLEDEKVVGEVKKMRVLTPYTVASRFNVRMSVAKDFLEQLENHGVVQLVSGNHSLKIYTATG